MERFYEIEVAGLKRKLRLCKVDQNMSIAAFIMFSDVEITIACAKELLAKVPEFDVILCPEAKAIPLAYEMARQSGKNYYVARKNVKVYMPEPVMARVKSITTLNEQSLFLDRSQLEEMKGKRVLVIDDVISTGATLDALEKLLVGSGAYLAAKASVLAEGEAAKRNDIVFLKGLPLFFNGKE